MFRNRYYEEGQWTNRFAVSTRHWILPRLSDEQDTGGLGLPFRHCTPLVVGLHDNEQPLISLEDEMAIANPVRFWIYKYSPEMHFGKTPLSLEYIYL